MAHILVVDDDFNILQVLRIRLESAGHEVKMASSATEALERLQTDPLDLALIDLKLGREDGMVLMEELRQQIPGLPVIILTAYGSIDTAVAAMKRGAYTYLTKPFDGQALLVQVDKALAQGRLSTEVKRLRNLVRESYRFDNIIGNSAAIREVLEQVSQAANTESSVYIKGDSGTGKELIAKALHLASPRREGPFVAINCAAIPETLLESELFGYQKGAFTGANHAKKGLLCEANGGTFFLDEISEMPPSMQVKLLRALEERSFFPLGARETVQVDIRIIAASNKSLEAAIKAGTFREDLFYRVHVIPIKLPSLRERKEDIPLLANHFLVKISREMNKSVDGFTNAAMKKMMAYDWPGNVRELENTIECAVAMSDQSIIDDEVILRNPMQNTNSDEDLKPLKDAKEAFERRYLIQLLELTRGNVSQAAKLAGKYRADLYGLLKKYALNPTDYRPAG
ncbi:MAG: sigma-54 dependent transcriptional regulator [Desulfobacterales bacterium]|jgi:two-component system response regulator GlrR